MKNRLRIKVVGDLTPNFSRSDFACACGCGFDSVNPFLLIVLEWIRNRTGEEVVVLVGCQCATVSARCPAEFHHRVDEWSDAVDIKVENKTPSQVYNLLDSEFPEDLGLGVYPDRLHIDVRSIWARWTGYETL